METEKPTFSLRWKIVLIVCVSTLSSALLITAWTHYTIRDVSHAKALEKLAGDTQLAANNVAAAYAAMRYNALAISYSTALSGLVRALRNGGIDPRYGNSVASLRARMAEIFSSILQSHPHFTQVRYIGMADNGREIVRVNRLPEGGLEVVATEDLQEKGQEPYFKETARLTAGEYYVSKVTYNREGGVTDQKYTPTVRMVLPTFTETGERFGSIVINADYELLLKSALATIPVGTEIYITDPYGSFIRRTRQGQVAPLEVSGAYRSTPPKFIEDFVAGRLTQGQFETSDTVGYCHRSDVTGEGNARTGTCFLTPSSDLFGHARQLILQNVGIGGVVTVLTGLMAALLANLHTWPIRRITAAIEAYGQRRGAELDLPIEALDEVGVMARAFRSLAENLDTAKERNDSLSIQLETFIQNSVDGIVMIDERGSIIEINPASLQIFGYARAELIGRNLSTLLPAPVAAQHDQYLRDYLRTGQQSFIGSIREVEGRHKNGNIIPLSVSVTEIVLPDKRRIFGGIVRDMSALHEAQSNIALYMAELERSNHELDQFAYVASHDLKAPLRVIDNASRWLEEDLTTKLTEEDRANMSLLRGRVSRMEKLLDDLLEYSRIGKAEDGRYSETICLSRLIDDIVLLLEPAPTMRIVVPGEFAGIEVYRMPLQRVLYNLIGNAIKHHDHKAGTIEVTAEEHADHFLFAVKDDGPGIPSAYREVIFEMFRTLKPRDKVEGSGMGLALVKKTVESKGGTISVDSCGERGSVFTFSWPKTQPQKMTQATGKAA